MAKLVIEPYKNHYKVTECIPHILNGYSHAFNRTNYCDDGYILVYTSDLPETTKIVQDINDDVIEYNDGSLSYAVKELLDLGFVSEHTVKLTNKRNSDASRQYFFHHEKIYIC